MCDVVIILSFFEFGNVRVCISGIKPGKDLGRHNTEVNRVAIRGAAAREVGTILGTEVLGHRIDKRDFLWVPEFSEIDLGDVKCCHHVVILVHEVMAMEHINCDKECSQYMARASETCL